MMLRILTRRGKLGTTKVSSIPRRPSRSTGTNHPTSKILCERDDFRRLLVFHFPYPLFSGEKPHSERLLSSLYLQAAVLRPLCALLKFTREDRLNQAD